MVNGGTSVAIIGIFILIISIVGQTIVYDQYSEQRPEDDNGPCEYQEIDTETCDRLNLMKSLWTPGWILIVIGVVVALIGLGIKEPQPQYIQQQSPQQQPPSYTCSTCGYRLTWIGPEQKYYCSSCGKYR